MSTLPYQSNPADGLEKKENHIDGTKSRILIRTNTLGIRADVANIETVFGLMAAAEFRRDRAAFLATFVNPSSVALAERNQDFRASLSRFDLVAPDGYGMCLAIKWLHGLAAPRLSFDNTSLAPPLFDFASHKGLSVALIGSKQGVADQAGRRLSEHFPNLRIVATIDGYGDLDEKIRMVHELSADIVICGMGAKMQEEFLLQLRDSNWSGFGFTCGGFFDQLLEGYLYYPSWVNALGLRWAYRLMKEPRRLWRRYLIDYGHFGMRLCYAIVFGLAVRGYGRPR